jgi:uroporphyrinogen decarboxylase
VGAVGTGCARDKRPFTPWNTGRVPLPATHPLLDGRTASAPLILAYRGEAQPTPPVWFMRQAGRSLPEYRAARAGVPMLESCLRPELASEITLQPVRRHRVDAAIFFSDIVIPLRLAGVGVDIVAGRGPVLEAPVRTAEDVARLRELSLDAEALQPITDAVGLTVAELGATPLIGFAGAPFTLAAYLVEGGPSKDHLRARTLMHADPDAWHDLLEWAADLSGAFLRAQLLAGASAGQLFDSWAGSLSRADYVASVAWASRRVFDAVRDLGAPLVHFGVGTGEILADLRDAGADVVGVDWRIPLDEAARRVGPVPLQGNLDPALLGAPWPVLERSVLDVIERGRAAPAHVLNLGHGVPADTDPDVLTRLVELVHDLPRP